jgi:mannitol/fructose-specific phosphotransferase system IIA component (Ntr-type)
MPIALADLLTEQQVILRLRSRKPANATRDYLICLGTLARLVKDDAMRSTLLNAETPREFIDALTAESL